MTRIDRMTLIMQVWYSFGAISVISAVNYDFEGKEVGLIMIESGGAMNPNSTNGFVFVPPNDRSWWAGLAAKASQYQFTLCTQSAESCGRYKVDNGELNLVKVPAVPRAFFVKDEGFQKYEVYFPKETY